MWLSRVFPLHLFTLFWVLTPKPFYAGSCLLNPSCSKAQSPLFIAIFKSQSLQPSFERLHIPSFLLLRPACSVCVCVLTCTYMCIYMFMWACGHGNVHAYMYVYMWSPEVILGCLSLGTYQLVFWDRVSHQLVIPGTHLSPPPQCLNYKHPSPCLGPVDRTWVFMFVQQAVFLIELSPHFENFKYEYSKPK